MIYSVINLKSILEIIDLSATIYTSTLPKKTNYVSKLIHEKSIQINDMNYNMYLLIYLNHGVKNTE